MSQRFDEYGYNLSAEHKHEHQSRCEQGEEDKRQPIITSEDVTLLTYQCDAPAGLDHRLIEHIAHLTIKIHLHIAFLLRHHLMTHSNNIGLGKWVGIVEDSLMDQSCGVRVYKDMTFLSQHDTVGVLVRHILCDNL